MSVEVDYSLPSVIASVVDEGEKYQFVSMAGVSSVSQRVITPSSSSPSGGTLTFSFQPPSTGVVMDTCLMLRCKVKLTTDANQELNKMCFESFPLNRAIQSLSLTVNGLTLTNSPSEFINVWERMHKDPQWIALWESGCPVQRNRCIELFQEGIYEYASSPYASGKYSREFCKSRFAWMMMQNSTSLNNRWANQVQAKGTQTIEVELVEPLLCDFLSMGGDPKGVFGINKIDVSIVFRSNLVDYMFSDPAPSGGTSESRVSAFSPVSPSVNSTAIPYFRTYSLDYNAKLGVVTTPTGLTTASLMPLGSANNAGDGRAVIKTLVLSDYELRTTYSTPISALPNKLVVPYNTVSRYTTSCGIIDNFDKTGIDHTTMLAYSDEYNASALNINKTFNSIKDSIVPEYVIIDVKRNLNNKKSYLADSYCPINKIDLWVNNTQGLFSSCSAHQLWKISVENGLDVPYDEWRYRGQCIIVLRCGKDIPASPATLGQFSIGGTVWFDSNYYYQSECEIEVFLIKNGYITIANGGASLVNGFDASLIEDKIRSGSPPVSPPTASELAEGRGGAVNWGRVWRKTRKILRKGVDLAAKYGPMVTTAVAPQFAPMVANVTGKAKQIADTVGLGVSTNQRLALPAPMSGRGGRPLLP